MFWCRAAPWVKARSISFPVASLAWRILRSECPPSLTRLNVPSSSVSKRTPMFNRSWIRSAASVIIVRTIVSSHNPSPLSSVSLICDSKPTPSVLSRIAAIPPCAQLVDESVGLCLVTTVTLCSASARRRAAKSPAIPLPMITTCAMPSSR